MTNNDKKNNFRDAIVNISLNTTKIDMHQKESNFWPFLWVKK